MSERPTVAIVGAGLGGLTVAAVLHHAGCFSNATVHVYERDASAEVRQHLGGSLDMHAGTGQAALKAAGLETQFKANSRPEGEAVIVTNKTGVPLFEDQPPPGKSPSDRPEIDRTVLRKLLLDALPADCVQWDHALSSASPVEDGTGRHELVFENGHRVTCALLIGADGARSRVRPLVSPAQPSYAGITGVEISLAPGSAPDLEPRVGNGMMCAFDSPGRAIMSQRNGDGRIRTYAWFKHDNPDAFPNTDPEAVLSRLGEMYADWAPWLREIIARADRAAVYPRPLFTLPPDHNWAHRKGVTLVGDAANLMSPFAGEGANVAMRAALDLAQALIGARSPDDWDAAVKKYEAKRVKYATSAAKESAENL
ncbi:FAD/NAD(P)-binding domain-containing protein, partial [Auricularia subglabra TFB-10046 SS5]